MFDEKHKRMNLLHSNHQIKKHASFSCVSRQIKITFYFKLAVNQNASISQNSKTSKSKSFRQLMFAKSIRVKFLFSIFMKSISENSIVSSYKMLSISEDIFYTSISRISLVFYSVNHARIRFQMLHFRHQEISANQSIRNEIEFEIETYVC